MSPEVAKLGVTIDPDFVDPHARSLVNKYTRDMCVNFATRKLGSRPDLLEKMIPKFRPWPRARSAWIAITAFTMRCCATMCR